MTVLASFDRTARKQHQCRWCQRDIAPGDRYRDVRYQYDGTVSTLRSHHECEDKVLRYGRYWAVQDDDPVEWWEVLEWVESQGVTS